MRMRLIARGNRKRRLGKTDVSICVSNSRRCLSLPLAPNLHLNTSHRSNQGEALPHQSLPNHKLLGSHRFRQPPAWITWVLGIIFPLDVPVLLLLVFVMWMTATDNAPDIPPGCSFMDPCPATPGEYMRSLVFCLGSILLWVVFAYSIYRLLLACFDARESADSRRTAIVVTSALLVGLSAVVLCVLPDWAYGGLCFRNRSGIPRASIPTRIFSRCFFPRSTPRTSRCAPAISHTPTRAHRRPLVRQVADHVTLLFCDVCKNGSRSAMKQLFQPVSALN